MTRWTQNELPGLQKITADVLIQRLAQIRMCPPGSLDEIKAARWEGRIDTYLETAIADVMQLLTADPRAMPGVGSLAVRRLLEQPPAYLRERLAAACATVGGVSSMLMVRQNEHHPIRIAASYKEGYPRDVMRDISIPTGAGIAGSVYDAGVAERIPLCERDSRHFNFPSNTLCPLYGAPRPGRYRDMMIVPVRYQGVDCLLQVMNSRETRPDFTDEDVRVLASVGADLEDPHAPVEEPFSIPEDTKKQWPYNPPGVALPQPHGKDHTDAA